MKATCTECGRQYMTTTPDEDALCPRCAASARFVEATRRADEEPWEWNLRRRLQERLGVSRDRCHVKETG